MSAWSLGFALNVHLNSDFWEHAAVVRALMDRLAGTVHHPLFDVDAPHAFESPYALFLALVARSLHVEAPDVFLVPQTLNPLFFYGAIYAFLKRVSPHARATFAFAVPATLVAWGTNVWVWSGFFHVESIVQTACYPSTFAGALLFVALCCAWDATTSSPKRARIALGGLTATLALCWLVHPMTAVIATASVCALVALRFAEQRTRAAFFAAIVVGVVGALAFLVASLWPLFPLVDLVTSTDNAEFDRASHVLYTRLLERTWPVLLAFAIAFVRLRKDKQHVLVVLALASASLFALGAYSREGLGRSISWFGIFAQLALADVLAAFTLRVVPQIARRFSPSTSHVRAHRVAATIVFALGAAWALGAHYPLTERCVPWGEKENIGRDVLRGRFHEGDVVVADALNSAFIPSFGGRVIAWRHPVYWVDDVTERRDALRAFFAKDATHDARVDVLRRFHARYIWLDAMHSQYAAHFEDLGSVVGNDARYALLRVDPSIVP